MATSPTITIIGLGQPYRGDDAAGLNVAERLADLQNESIRVIPFLGDATELMHLWKNAAWLILIDAAKSGQPAGTIHHFDAHQRPLPSFLSSWSSHAFGLPEAITLARQFGQLPPRIEVYGIEGERFSMGEPMTPAVAAACRKVAGMIRKQVQAYLNPA
ncbi:MAG: hydrogenase maturation protease [candidate division KSB1 bacterium]|nr:hydrogenase maturation protease [candidate division KSB1 bacterium]MDQ7063846.1 hydrogenase maturation protease [candidate division KSB1 bacterium]